MSTVFYYAEDGQKHPIDSNEEAKQLVDEGKLHATTWIEVDGRIYHAKNVKAWASYFTERDDAGTLEPSAPDLSSELPFNRTNETSQNRKKEEPEKKTRTSKTNKNTAASRNYSGGKAFIAIQKKYGFLQIDEDELFKAAKDNLPDRIKDRLFFMRIVNKILFVITVFYGIYFINLLFNLSKISDNPFITPPFIAAVCMFILLLALKLTPFLELRKIDAALLKSRDDLRQTIYLNEILKSLDKKNDETKEKE